MIDNERQSVSRFKSGRGLTVAFWKFGMKHEFVSEFDNNRNYRAMEGVERRIPKRWTEAEDEVLYREARSQCKLPFTITLNQHRRCQVSMDWASPRGLDIG